MHRPHPDPHQHGLVDECPGCDDLAADPFARMDADLLRFTAERAVDRANNGIDSAASDAQLTAEKHVLNVLERVGALATAAPHELERYLRGRWRIECRIVGRAAA